MRQVHTLSVLLAVGVAGLAWAQIPAEGRHARPRTSAAAELQKACDGGSCEACGRLAEMYRRGEGVARDEARAARFQERACKKARLFASRTEAEKESRRLKRECEAGKAKACRMLGTLYENGEGVAKDDAKAAAYFRRACNGGNGIGCFRLGLMYDLGYGVELDRPRAIPLYHKACDGGVKFACFNLGFAYEYGTVVPQDLPRAARFYRRSCELGNPEGCEKLGLGGQLKSQDAPAAEQHKKDGKGRKHRR